MTGMQNYCGAAKRVLHYAALVAGVAGTSLLPMQLAQAQSADKPVALGGTTIIGDRELPIGLYISPWRSATPGKELDKPSRYLDVGRTALDPEVFKRQVEYLDALDAAARRK